MKQIFIIYCFYRLKFVSNRWVTKQTGILPYGNTRPRDELAQLVIGVRGRMVIKMTELALIYEFLKTGLFAVGGGLATIPFLKAIAEKYDWFSSAELTNMIAIAESTPGPIGVNMATYAGVHASGVLGGILATLALVLPSIIVITIISHFLKRFKDSKIVNNVFYALRPASAGLIASAMFPVLLSSIYNISSRAVNPLAIILFIVFLTACFLNNKLKKPIHPIAFIGLGALLGALLGEYLEI